MEITVRAKPGKEVRGIMTDLPYNAVRVEMDGALASFIGAHGEVLGQRVMGTPRRYRCEGCGRLCHMATYSDRAPECPSSKPEANWLIVTQEEWQKTVRLATELRNLPTPRAHRKEGAHHETR